MFRSSKRKLESTSPRSRTDEPLLYPVHAHPVHAHDVPQHLREPRQVPQKDAAPQTQSTVEEIAPQKYLPRNNGNTIFDPSSTPAVTKSYAGHTSEPRSRSSSGQSSSESNIPDMDSNDPQEMGERSPTSLFPPQRSHQSSLNDANPGESNSINITIVALLAAAVTAAIVLLTASVIFPPSSFMLLLAFGNIGEAIAAITILVGHVALFSCSAGLVAGIATSSSQDREQIIDTCMGRGMVR